VPLRGVRTVVYTRVPESVTGGIYPGTWECYRWCILRVYIGCDRWCIPRGVHRVYIPGCTLPICLPTILWWIYTTLVYLPTYTPWVYTTTLLSTGYRCSNSRCSGRKPWAQAERNPWVRGRGRVNVVIPVRVDGRLCAELLPSSRTFLPKIG